MEIDRIGDRIERLDGILTHAIRIGEDEIVRLIRNKIKECERELQRAKVRNS